MSERLKPLNMGRQSLKQKTLFRPLLLPPPQDYNKLRLRFQILSFTVFPSWVFQEGDDGDDGDDDEGGAFPRGRPGVSSSMTYAQRI